MYTIDAVLWLFLLNFVLVIVWLLPWILFVSGWSRVLMSRLLFAGGKVAFRAIARWWWPGWSAG